MVRDVIGEPISTWRESSVKTTTVLRCAAALLLLGAPALLGAADESESFKKTGLGQGVGELYVNGAKVAETKLPKMHLSTFSLSETFDVGADYGSAVSPNYKSKDPHFPYTGALDKVTITLTGDDPDKAKEVDDSAELD